MKRYSVAGARAKLAQVLDLAEQGEAVVIERRGVRFAVHPLKSKPERGVTRRSRIEILDPAVEAGQWSWAWSDGGIELEDRRKPARKSRA